MHKPPCAERTADPMTVDARLRQETLPCLRGWLVRQPPAGFIGQPPLEVFRRINNDAKQHIGMLRAAIFGALANKQPALLGLKPHVSWCGRGSGRSSRQPRYPEAMAHIGGFEGQETRVEVDASLAQLECAARWP